MNFITWIIFGALVGWISSLIMKTEGGLLWNIVMGIIGSTVGGFIFNNLLGQSGVTGFNFYSIIVGVIGAMVIIFLSRLVRK